MRTWGSFSSHLCRVDSVSLLFGYNDSLPAVKRIEIFIGIISNRRLWSSKRRMVVPPCILKHANYPVRRIWEVACVSPCVFGMVLEKKHLLLRNSTHGTLITYNLYMGKPIMVFSKR
jgi:hypothetical protein